MVHDFRTNRRVTGAEAVFGVNALESADFVSGSKRFLIYQF
jgi:hypothetical protein